MEILMRLQPPRASLKSIFAVAKTVAALYLARLFPEVIRVMFFDLDEMSALRSACVSVMKMEPENETHSSTVTVLPMPQQYASNRHISADETAFRGNEDHRLVDRAGSCP